MANTRTEPEAGTPVLGGNELDFGPGLSRLLVQTWKSLAKGDPVSPGEVERIARDLGVEQTEADGFLRRMSERDASDNIVGVIGLSLNDHPHQFTIDVVALRRWCVADVRFLPAILRGAAEMESKSPLTGEIVRLPVISDLRVTTDRAGLA